jgi:transcriptional regulator with XRE-family HTH domain
MPELKVKNATKKTSKRRQPQREFVFSTLEQTMLKRIGRKIHKDLFEQKRAVEALAIELGIARSTLREIIAGRSNARILTLNQIAEGLGYKGLVEFLLQA